MPECLPDIPAGSSIRQNPDGSWQYRRRNVGPWLPMPAPQGAASWVDGPAPATITLADRLALRLCRLIDPATGTCATGEICRRCRQYSAAVAHELAAILRERHGSSATADWLDGVGCHTP
jgi:hypothetical protein